MKFNRVKPKDIQVAAGKIFRAAKKANQFLPEASIISAEGKQYIMDNISAVVFNEPVAGIPVISKETGTWKIPEDNNKVVSIIDKLLERARRQTDLATIWYDDAKLLKKKLEFNKMISFEGLKVFTYDRRQLIDFGKDAQLVNLKALENILRMLAAPNIYYGASFKEAIYIKGINGEALLAPINCDTIKKFLYGEAPSQEITALI